MDVEFYDTLWIKFCRLQKLAAFSTVTVASFHFKVLQQKTSQEFINCSQTKFVEIMLVLWSFLFDFLPNRSFIWPICLRPPKRNKNVTPRGHQDCQGPKLYYILQIRFTKTVLRRQFHGPWCGGLFLILKKMPPVTPSIKSLSTFLQPVDKDPFSSSSQRESWCEGRLRVWPPPPPTSPNFLPCTSLSP